MVKNRPYLTFYLITLMMLLCVSSVQAVIWSDYNINNKHWNFRSDITNVYSSTPDSSITVSAGLTGYQPVYIEYNDVKYGIFISGTSLGVYDPSLTLVDDCLISPDTQPVVKNDIIIVSAYNKTYTYNFTGTLTKILELNTTSNISRSSHVCSDDDDICYMINTTNDVCYFDHVDGNNITCVGAVSSAVDSQEHFPALDDIYNDGNERIVWMYDNKNLAVFNTETLALDTSFSGDGLLSIGTDASDMCSHPAIYNINGAGVQEIVVICSEKYGIGGGLYARYSILFEAIKPDGTDVAGFPSRIYNTLGFATVVPHSVSTPAFCDADDAQRWICGYAHSEENVYGCVDESGTARYSSGTGGGVVSDSFNIVSFSCADVNNDGRDEFFIGEDNTGYISVINLSGTEIVQISSDRETDSIIAVDVNNDNFVDIVKTRTDNTVYYFSGITNSVPSINNSYESGGFYGYYENPVCLHTNMTFISTEGEGYTNDYAADNERIVTNCGQNYLGYPITSYTQNLFNHSFSLDTPFATCVFNRTGTYRIRLYLQDDSNTGDYSQYNTEDIIVQVIDGVEGDTCNIDVITSPDDVGVTEETTPEQDAVDESVSETIGILTGTSPTLKIIAGFGIVIAVVFMAAQAGLTSPVALVLITVMGLAIVTFLGLIPAWFIIVMIIVGVLILVFKNSVSSGGS